ncbi:uncharacterized protein LOC121837825 [Ixodes scapularis]|uniref:uncharacterized protein LOC121837825 n=2 Tax=Ixodes scapularis TaxID=6945 RepID=UPI001C386B2D|nr:uncharacterized protein LOC121837825 [Ixodes scapularis]
MAIYLSYVHHAIPPHQDNEYIVATVTDGKGNFTIIAGYIPPKAKFDEGYLTDILSKKDSSYAKFLIQQEPNIPKQFETPKLADVPPWTLTCPTISLNIDGIQKKASTAQTVLKQLTLSLININHRFRTHIYTDGSTTHQSSAAGVVIPMEQVVLKFRLGHRTSSTVSELVAIRESLKYIIRTEPRAWSVFTDSKAALQSMQHYLRRGANEQLTFTVVSLCQQAQQAGHHIHFQWIPSHCGVPGNEAADQAAKSGHDNISSISVPYSRTDAGATVFWVGKKIGAALWASPSHHYPRLYNIDPELKFRPPRNLTRKTESVLHRIRLGVAFTYKYLHCIGKKPSANCLICEEVESLEHLLCTCTIYDVEREVLTEELSQLDSRPFSLQKILGAWESPEKLADATKYLLRFLRDTQLICRL